MYCVGCFDECRVCTKVWSDECEFDGAYVPDNTIGCPRFEPITDEPFDVISLGELGRA